MIYSLLAANILPILALVSLAIRPARFAIPWLGLATVVLGTGPAFSSSATYYSDRSIGAGIGWPVTSIYGLIGLGIVVAYVKFRPSAFIPLGATIAGVIHVASFYAFLPPFAVDSPGGLVAAAPGFLLVAYGAYLWYRYGLAESLQHRSVVLRPALALAIVAGLGVLGYLQFEGPRPHKLLSYSPNFSHMAEYSALVVEGVIVNKEPFNYSYEPRRTPRFTLYEMEVANFWRGTSPQIVRFIVPYYSPVEMTVGKPYLIFAQGFVDPEKLPEYLQLLEPVHVWTPLEGKFYPYPGMVYNAPISRDFLADLLESQPYEEN